MKTTLSVLLVIVITSLTSGQDYSAFEYVYATAGSPSVRVVTVEFRDSKGVKFKFEHDLDLSRNQLDRTLTLTSGYITGRNHAVTFTAHRGYYTSIKGRAIPEVSSVLDQLVELLPATGAGNDLDNDRVLQRRVVGAVLRLNQLLAANQAGNPHPNEPSGSGNWNSFWSSFQTAVRNRDRSALRDMMSNPFEYSGANPSDVNPDFVLRDLDSRRGEGWAALQRTASLISTAYKLPNSRRAARVVKNPLPCGRRPCDYTEWIIFEFGTDGRWRWISLLYPGD